MNDPLRMLGWALHGGGLAIVLSSACLVQCLVYRPLQTAADQTLARHAEIETLLKEVNPLRAERDRLKQSLALAREEERRLANRVPDAPHEAAFLGQVSRLAQQVELQIRDYRPGEVHAQPNYSEMEISLTCEGTYDSLCRFLDGLSRLPRLVKLSRLDISDPAGDGPYPATMKLLVYFSSEPKPAAPVLMLRFGGPVGWDKLALASAGPPSATSPKMVGRRSQARWSHPTTTARRRKAQHQNAPARSGLHG